MLLVSVLAFRNALSNTCPNLWAHIIFTFAQILIFLRLKGARMSHSVLLAVIMAALLHASWNAAVKGGSDKLTQMAAVTIGHVPFAAVGLLILPPIDWVAWPYLIAGGLLHFGYQIFLVQSYKIGDLTQVYPIARGTAPLVVTVVSVAYLGVPLNSLQIFGILCIAGGILLIGLRTSQNNAMKATLTAIITGCFIASYSLNDGLGARISTSPIAFYCWLAFLNAALMGFYVHVIRHVNPITLPIRTPLIFWGGGFASFGAYALVVWAFSQAPIALVTALRETSMIFALMIGYLFMNERLSRIKMLAVTVTLLGVLVIRFNS